MLQQLKMYKNNNSYKCIKNNKKYRFEEQLNKIDGTLSTIEFQREALENASTNTEVLKNMQHASQALKAAHKNMDVEQVELALSLFIKAFEYFF